MAETAAEEGGAAHLPHQPRQGFGALRGVGGQKGAEFFGEMDQDRPRFEHPDRFGAAAVDKRGDLAVRIGANEAARKLVALADVDQPSVIFGTAVARREQFLEHHGDLHAVGRAERIKLERMLADRQVLVVRRTRDGPVDIGETTAAFLVPRPDLRRHIFAVIGHRELLG